MIVIEAKNISKQYNISHKEGKYFVLRDKIKNIATRPFTIFADNKKDEQDIFWALKDINFQVNMGDVLGVIGHNGAGKSTLLKIISRITLPTSGMIRIKGRVASLLEIGTGFHQELSGRENIFLNGVILGMKKREIKKRLDEIVDFSGVENFLDTPVKHYSSGMYVRLAFAVAAHMESDIILLDEILSVGDMEFQKKCLNKISEIVRRKDRTIVFVSHNINSVKDICNSCILLNHGKIDIIDTPDKAIKKYIENSVLFSQQPVNSRQDRSGQGNIKITDIRVESITDEANAIHSGDRIRIVVKYKSDLSDLRDTKISLVLYNQNNMPLIRFDSGLTKKNINNFKPSGEVVCTTDKLNLGKGGYYMNAGIWADDKLQDFITNAVSFDVLSNNSYYDFTNNFDKRTDNILVPHTFEYF